MNYWVLLFGIFCLVLSYKLIKRLKLGTKFYERQEKRLSQIYMEERMRLSSMGRKVKERNRAQKKASRKL